MDQGGKHDHYDAPFLARRTANHVALTPLSFLARAAAIYPNKIAIIHGARRMSYAEFHARCRRLGDALRRHGIAAGDVVAIMAPNIPPLLEAHYGVAMAGGVLNAINTRLDARSIAFILDHGGAKIVIADREFSATIAAAMDLVAQRPLVVEIDDKRRNDGQSVAAMEYEAFLASGDSSAPSVLPEDEWQAIALGYTSGTTGNPKGVVTHHRGAYLNALGNAIVFGLSAETVYLWSLPMFHCNGWTYTWAVTAACGTHVCLPRVDAAAIFAAIAEHGVTHLCGAPIILTMLVHAPAEIRRDFARRVEFATGGAAPPSAVNAAMERLGFNVTHLYGLTECFGPAMLCASQAGWADLAVDERTAMMARQGVRYPTLEGVRVVDPATMADVPADGATLGELVLRGNTVMKGYLKNPVASAEAFAGGWFHTGDLAVMHGDGYAEIKDRAKDIIISGGENISSLEIEEVLYRHPAIMEAAVVARPDAHWGESPCAFVTLRPGGQATQDSIIAWCRDNLAHFKAPRSIVFGPLPKTATGKIQKFVLRERAKAL